MHLFGTSGIRRLVDRDLIEISFKVGLAAGSLYSNVIVGRDTRTSGSVLRHAVMAGLLAAGARASDSGILPTPTLAFTTREFKAGIMITASHNPPQYNGLKLLNPDGSAFSPEQQREIEALVEGDQPSKLTWDRMQTGEVYSTAIDKHISRIKQDFPGGIRARVVVDSGGGAAFFITAHLLTQLGCEVVSLNGFPSGVFPHDVEPVAGNLGELMRAVVDSAAGVGIAHDGDADRMMAVDEKGRFIPGDKMMALLIRTLKARNVVTTLDASMSIEDLHLAVRRTRVGDPYVSEELKKGGEFGGEPSGAWVFPSVSLCPDGIYAAAQIAALAGRHTLSTLVDALPSYPVIRGNVNGKADPRDLEAALASMGPTSWDKSDGLKLGFADGWVLVRPSGTEPKIRLTAEARNEAAAHQLYEKAYGLVSKLTQENR